MYFVFICIHLYSFVFTFRNARAPGSSRSTVGCGIGLRPPHHGREASQAVPARFGWIPHGFNGFRAAGSPGKSGGKHKNDLQEARSARLASSQVSSPHASRTCTCLAHTHSLRPRRMSEHARAACGLQQSCGCILHRNDAASCMQHAQHLPCARSLCLPRSQSQY